MSDASQVSQHENQVNRILADYLEAQRLGQTPDREDVLRRHPELADELRSFFADQDRFGQIAQHISPPAALAAASGPAATLDSGGSCRARIPHWEKSVISATTSCSRRSRGEAWASSTRPGR